MSLRVRATDMRVLPMHTRMPFRYGIATLTALPHLFVRVEAEIDGVSCVGVASDGLVPKWFTYFTGLSMYPQELQECVLEHHGDLYYPHPRGFVTLNIYGGRIDISSILAAPFGLAFPFDTGQYLSLEQAGLFFDT